MKTLLSFLVIIAALSFTNANAAGGVAGCGPGAVLLEKNTVFSQTLAFTTNAYFSTFQGTSVAFGLSKCSRIKKFVKLDEKAESQVAFIENNYRHLEIESAQGEGDTLATLSRVMGCSEPASFQSVVQQNYNTIFTEIDLSPVDVWQNLRHAIDQEKSLATTCSSI